MQVYDTPPSTLGRKNNGFTLIELSIVLVIIGLIIGGVLVGRDLIASAQTRAQIAQIEQFKVAVNTFKAKYNHLPGDMPQSEAIPLGFVSRGAAVGEGDANGIIQASCSLNPGFSCSWTYGSNTYNQGHLQAPSAPSEVITFWADLSSARLIQGDFTNPSNGSSAVTETSNPSLQNYYPRGKISGNYLFVWSGGILDNGSNLRRSDGKNYMALAGISQIGSSGFSRPLRSYSGLRVAQAFNIDTKVDDGLPQSGRVMAMIPTTELFVGWSDGQNTSGAFGLQQSGSGASTGSPTFAPTTAATPYATTNCFDNNNVVGDQKYQLQNADARNCSLSFQF